MIANIQTKKIKSLRIENVENIIYCYIGTHKHELGEDFFIINIVDYDENILLAFGYEFYKLAKSGEQEAYLKFESPITKLFEYEGNIVVLHETSYKVLRSDFKLMKEELFSEVITDYEVSKDGVKLFFFDGTDKYI